MKELFLHTINSLLPPGENLHVAVAVSGGADSLALGMLTRDWISDHGGRITALIVDHGLRPESFQEAQRVGQWLKDLNIPYQILTWEGEKPTTRIQEKARQARYQLLERWCQDHHVPCLLTAHHQDDQWETMMQRITRHSGVVGLQGILPCVQRPFGEIFRPFLGISKSEILAYLKKEAQGYIEDPSNLNLKYERVRWRQERSVWEEKGYTKARIEGIRQQAIETVLTLDKDFETWKNQHLVFHELGYLSFPVQEWSCLDRSSQSYFLKKMIQFFPSLSGESPYPLEMSSNERVLDCFQSNGHSPRKKALTIRGCYLCQHQGRILITREVRALQHSLALKPVNQILSPFTWDRFRIRTQNFVLEEIQILGHYRAQKMKALKHEVGKDVPSYVLASLPVIGDEEIVFLHELGKKNPQRMKIDVLWGGEVGGLAIGGST